MTREQFFALPQNEKDLWEQRLKDQWGLDLKEVRQFGFAGDRITNVTMVANLDYRRDPIETRRLMGADQAGETP